jgi:hypothetical protein
MTTWLDWACGPLRSSAGRGCPPASAVRSLIQLINPREAPWLDCISPTKVPLPLGRLRVLHLVRGRLLRLPAAVVPSDVCSGHKTIC